MCKIGLVYAETFVSYLYGLCWHQT
jgi:hypothetical protein